MGLELVGIKTTPAGHIQVNDRLETTAPGVWAMGDCAGSPHFTHISFDDFRTVRDNLGRSQPHAPQPAARSPLRLHRPRTSPRRPDAKAKQNNRESLPSGQGSHAGQPPRQHPLRDPRLHQGPRLRDDRILGFTAFGAGVGELLPVVQLAMSANLPYTAIRVSHRHPPNHLGRPRHLSLPCRR